MQEDTDNSACISGKTLNKKYSFLGTNTLYSDPFHLITLRMIDSLTY